jgi:DNA-binding NarL/FixJ family response regulator
VSRLRVHVDAAERKTVDGLHRKLRQAGIAVTPEHDPPPQTVIVSAAGTVEEAVGMCREPATGPFPSRLLIVDSFGRDGMLRAVRAGVRVMLRSTEADPSHLATAVRSAHHGECSLPRDALLGLLAGDGGTERGGSVGAAGAGPDQRPELPGGPAGATLPVLTPRQTEMLGLVAEGFDNATIAQALVVSEHTVKNVIYDLMSRMQVHNRTHAAAQAIRTGII